MKIRMKVERAVLGHDHENGGGEFVSYSLSGRRDDGAGGVCTAILTLQMQPVSAWKAAGAPYVIGKWLAMELSEDEQS